MHRKCVHQKILLTQEKFSRYCFVIMSVAEYCMDPDANIIFDEESLQTAIDMYNDRVVREKHMVGRELSPSGNQYHQ